MLNWAHAGPTVAAAFLASLVEFVEALTVVLAVGAVRGWRHALAGAGLGLLVLMALVAVMNLDAAREVWTTARDEHRIAKAQP